MSTEMMNRPEANTAALAVADVMNTGVAYTDMNLSDRKQAVAFYNATANPDMKLKEHVNEVIDLVHVSVECAEVNAQLEDGSAGKVIAPRIVLIDAEGKSYSCVSTGIYNSLKRLFALVGNPETWTEPVKVKPILISTKKGQVLSLVLV